jgi:hypothetical protein
MLVGMNRLGYLPASSPHSLLHRHRLQHSGEKPFACDHVDSITGNRCEYRCNQRANLQKHQMLHSGEKPFACDQCDYRCIQKVDLGRHLQMHQRVQASAAAAAVAAVLEVAAVAAVASIDAGAGN